MQRRRHPALRAAYLSLLDQWLEQLTSRFRNRPESILLQVCGVGGGRWLPSISSTPLPGRLDAASIQAPWIVWESPRSQGSTGWDPGRSRAMVQPGDLGPTTLEWLGLAGGSSNPAAAESPGYSGASVWPLIRGELTALRPWVKTTSAGDSFSVWSLHDQVIFDAAPLPDGIVESAHVQRFRQPEDPWNAFNVAGESQVRVAEVIQGLRQYSSGPSDQPS